MRVHAVVGYLLAVFPLIATPGASMTLLTQKVVPRGPGAGVPVIVGTVCGLYVHAMLAAVGLSALVMQSAQLFTAVRIAGAVYLIGLGLWTLRTSFIARHENRRSRFRMGIAGSTFGQALFANVLNPKAALIFLTLVPQFVNPEQPMLGQILILTTAQSLLIVVWLVGWAVVIGNARRAFRSPSFTTVVRRVTGSVLVGLGIRTMATTAG